MPQPQERLARAKKLKDKANDLFTKKEYKAASAKYTDAIAFNVEDKNFMAVLYANRSACRLKQTKYFDAATDALKATELNPNYSKAWARLATAKDSLKRPSESASAWRKAIKTLPKDNLTEEMIKQKGEYELALASVQEVIDNARPRSNDLRLPSVIRQSDAPWNIAKGMLARLWRENNFESSAWVVGTAYQKLEKGSKSVEEILEHPERFDVKLGLLEDLSDSVLLDTRVLHFNKSDWVAHFVIEFYAEVMGRLGSQDGEPDDIIQIMKVRLESEGWDKVRPSLDAVIRIYIMYGFIEARMLDNPSVEFRYLHRAIRVLEHGRHLWSNIPSNDRHSVVFQDNFIHGVMKLYMDALVQVYHAEHDVSMRQKILDELLERATFVIDSINSLDPPFCEQDPAFAGAFYYYARGHAYASQGFCHYWQKAMEGVPPEAMELHQQAAQCYLEASTNFYCDDEWRVAYLKASIEHMKYGGFPVRVVLQVLEKLRLSLAHVETIWGMWMLKTDSKRSYKHTLELEPELRRLLAEGKITEEHGMCSVDIAFASGIEPEALSFVMDH
ncbi:TPR-like protein [Marasmius fiardii PR-910]|nr:TPR-like protein [Marasmius fiardii PR-910]